MRVPGAAPEKGDVMTDLTVDAEAGTEPVLFNPFEPGFFEQPYEQYRRIRTHDPVHHSPLDLWMLFAYDACFKLLRDPGMSVDPAVAEQLAPGERNRFAELRAAHPDLPEPQDNRGSSTSTRRTTRGSAG